MNRRRALLVSIALLALADLVGVSVLREAWNARHERVASADRQTVRIQPVNVSFASESLVAHRKATGSSQPTGWAH
ncbi:hypothetical protein [Silanimonas sp.]|jgi:hypothetical protein|uniref:hypothetical protein n=1 Tax=Silanimonas sp. TaxID=1929290 RepID=UPI0022C5155D|nr:hypothetical protein [Silanimonas sp.]MCZ8166745.1 hypothetical protein [Silanimonas sp.]